LCALSLEPLLTEVAAWHVFDANARVGRSGVHGELALEAPELLLEMDRFGLERALVSHFASEEYDAQEGNCELGRLTGERLVPAWAGLPDRESLDQLAARRPAAVRLHFGVTRHNFSPALWCSGELYAYLQDNSVLVLVALEDIGWSALVEVLENFSKLPILLLETGYRADRYLFPLLRKFPNLYFDTSTYLAHRQLEAFVQRFGPARMVFGSRLPLYTPAAALFVLGTARIRDDARLAIAGLNLRRLLKGAAA
jgi:hypothetical protein